MGAKHVVQVLLLGAIVLALSSHMHAKQVAVKLDAGVRIPHNDGGMVDTQKKLIRGTVPLLQALIRRELQHLNRMAIRILEVERRDARRVLVPVRKALWSRRSVFYLVLTQPGISLIHVANNDRDVLKPPIITARINWDRAPLRGEILGEFDKFVVEPHPYRAHSQAEYTFQMLIVLASDFGIRHLFERKDFGIEIHRPIHVGDRDSDCVYAFHQSGVLLGQSLLGEELEKNQSQRQYPDC